MSSAKQISDIGPDISSSYAQNQKFREENASLLSDMRFVPGMAAKDVQIPYRPGEIDTLFQWNMRNKPCSAVKPPEGYNSYKVALFTHQVAPSLGSEEMLQAHLQRVNEVKEQGTQKLDATDVELSLRLDEAAKMDTMLEEVVRKDKDSIRIITERDRYQKG